MASDAAGYFALIHARLLFLFGFFIVFIAIFLARARNGAGHHKYTSTDSTHTSLDLTTHSPTTHTTFTPSARTTSTAPLSSTTGDALLSLLWGTYHLVTAWSWRPSTVTGNYNYNYYATSAPSNDTNSSLLLWSHAALGILFVAAALQLLLAHCLVHVVRYYNHSATSDNDLQLQDYNTPSYFHSNSKVLVNNRYEKAFPLSGSTSVSAWQRERRQRQSDMRQRSLRHSLAQLLFILNGIGQLYGAYQLAFEHEQMFVWRGEAYRVEWIQRFVVPMAIFAFGSVLFGLFIPTTVGIATTKVANAGRQRQTEDLCKVAFGVVWLLYHLLAIPDAFFMGLHSASTGAVLHAGLAGAFLFYLRSIKMV